MPLNAPWTVKLIVTSGVEPTLEQLNIGDLCFNVADGRLFFRLLSGEITELLSTSFLSSALLTQAQGDLRYAPLGSAGSAAITQVNHGLSAGDAVLFGPQGWQQARSDQPETLARGLVASVLSANAFRLAVPGALVFGFSDLLVGEWYHCSPTLAGNIEPLSGSGQSLPGACAANPLGQAVSTSALWFFSINPYFV